MQRPYGAISSDEPEATDVGIALLEKGGNAVDAAVAMQFALAVTQVKNADLAKTFRLIEEQGTDVFYRGEIAAAIIEATRRNRVPDGSGVGKMTLADIADYSVDTDALVGVRYRDYDLRSVGGSSAGGYVALGAL